MVLALLRGTTRQRQVKVPEARKSSCCVCPAWGLRFSKLALRVLGARERDAVTEDPIFGRVIGATTPTVPTMRVLGPSMLSFFVVAAQ